MFKVKGLPNLRTRSRSSSDVEEDTQLDTSMLVDEDYIVLRNEFITNIEVSKQCKHYCLSTQGKQDFKTGFWFTVGDT